MLREMDSLPVRYSLNASIRVAYPSFDKVCIVNLNRISIYMNSLNTLWGEFVTDEWIAEKRTSDCLAWNRELLSFISFNNRKLLQ